MELLKWLLDEAPLVDSPHEATDEQTKKFNFMQSSASTLGLNFALLWFSLMADAFNIK